MSYKFKTTNIKGKEYVEVNERIKYFRNNSNYQGWSLTTEIVELTDEKVVLRALITNNEGKLISTGLAYEKADSSFINKTSYIENCETSAWGRALGNLGIGIDTSIASSEEVQNAIENQGKNKELDRKINETTALYNALSQQKKDEFSKICKEKGLTFKTKTLENYTLLNVELKKLGV